MEQPFKAPFHTRSRLTVPGRHGTPPCSRRASPSLFGLAPCGVYPASGVTDGAVRSYRTISPLPRRGLAVQANLSGLSGMPCYVASDMAGVAEAVSFLWHWPSTGLEARVPDVIRHTALRSSDFPPPASAEAGPAATARSSCQWIVYPTGALASGQSVPGISERIRRTISCNSGTSCSTVSQIIGRLTEK